MVARHFQPFALLSRARRSPARPYGQGGFLTVSVMLVLFAIAAMLTLYVERQSERTRLERGEQIGYALSVLGAGFNLYLDTNHAALAKAEPEVPGVVHALQPTAAELIRLANIRGVSPKPPVIPHANYRFQVTFPPDCTPARKLSETACRPVGIAYIDRPMRWGETVDFVALSRAARVMQGRGGYSRPENVTRFVFPDGPASKALVGVPNPTGTAGILAWRADTLSLDRERLLVNGGNRMNTTLRLDGAGRDHDIQGVANITASGHMTLQGDMRSKGNISVAKNAEIRGVTRVNDLNFSVTRYPGGPCENMNSIGIAPGGEILYCNLSKTWASTHPSRPHDITHLEFHAPSGFLAELAKYYFSFGNWIYCRAVRGASTLWYEDHQWKASVRGNSGSHQVMCFGRLN